MYPRGRGFGPADSIQPQVHGGLRTIVAYVLSKGGAAGGDDGADGAVRLLLLEGDAKPVTTSVTLRPQVSDYHYY